MLFNIKLVSIAVLTFFVVVVDSKRLNQTVNYFREMFAQYQVQFDKQYENRTDAERAFNNFANNLDTINNLNAELAKATNNTKMYVVNKYADENPEEFDEHYGFKLVPYEEVNAKETLRNQVTENNGINTKSITDAHLYDLYKADQLYEKYLKVFNKKNATSKRIQNIRYYRFVKTLVDINKNNMEGKPLRTLDDQADKVQKPHEYFTE